MELIFLDPGLVNKAGHSYKLAKTVSRNLDSRNLRHRIFGLHNLESSIAAEIDATPHFSRSLYDGEDLSWSEKRLRAVAALVRGAYTTATDRSERRSWKRLNEDFERDLAALPGDVWKPDNLVCVVAISQNQILGLARFLRRLPHGRQPYVVCNLMFPPSFVPWGTVSRSGKKYFRHAFDLAAPLTDTILHFTVENEAMRVAYHQDFGLNTQILPLPFGDREPKHRRKGPARIGFFGDSKCDKGFHLLPGAIARCQRAGLGAEFVVQIQHNHWEPRTIEAERALRMLNCVRLLEGILSGEDYDSWLTETDVILLPYDPIAFGPARGSGIFAEAVAGGCPIVATKGTFAADSISRQQAEGEIFAPHTSEALAGAIARLLPRLTACTARAAERAKDYAKSHSPDAFVDALLTLAKTW
jgi:glycosyltransferase involved in cell wall biosynthesis